MALYILFWIRIQNQIHFFSSWCWIWIQHIVSISDPELDLYREIWVQTHHGFAWIRLVCIPNEWLLSPIIQVLDVWFFFLRCWLRIHPWTLLFDNGTQVTYCFLPFKWWVTPESIIQESLEGLIDVWCVEWVVSIKIFNLRSERITQ